MRKKSGMKWPAWPGAVVHYWINGLALVRYTDGRVNPWAVVRL